MGRPEGTGRKPRTGPGGAVLAQGSVRRAGELPRARTGCAPAAKLLLYHGREYDVELERQRGRVRAYWDRDKLAWRTEGVQVSVESALRVREVAADGRTVSTKWTDARLCYLPPRHTDGVGWANPMRRAGTPAPPSLAAG